MTYRRATWIALVALILAGVLWSTPPHAPTSRPTAVDRPLPPAAEHVAVAEAEPSAPRDASTFEMPPPAPEATPLAAAQPPATARVLLRATYGDDAEQLGIIEPGYGFDGLIYPPQGFAPLPDGRLLVLDTAKTRLVWFGADGRMERAWPLPSDFRLPADVVVTKDGTIVVVDDEGVETSGTVMFDSAGNIKARLPQLGALMTDVYAAGNDILFASGILESVKAGDTSGSASDETPDLFNQDGVIPGRVAPDGRTVVHASIVRGDKRQLLVSAVRGPTPAHVFSRVYAQAQELWSISSLQIDGHGTIYIVLGQRGGRTLLCLDGDSGDPIGHVLLPRQEADGMPFSPFVVPETGGLVMQQLHKDGVSYHFIDCRPGA